jgi:hypothetical protein
VQVPRYVCFWCDRTAWLGGDTCLVDGAAAFRDLPAALRRLLSRHAFRVRRVASLKGLAQTYGVYGRSLDAFCVQCRHSGVSARPHPDRPGEYLLVEFQKPSVWRTRAGGGRVRTSIALNFGECGVAAREALLQGLLDRGFFSGPQWAVHRALWVMARFRPWFRALLGYMDAIRSVLADALRGFPHWRNPPPPAEAEFTLGAALTPKQQQQLGRALASHIYAFRWQPGDVLLLDNAQTLHDGMPGFGPRRLRVMLLNEAAVPQSLDARLSGILDETDLRRQSPEFAWAHPPLPCPSERTK